jgi:hypothetical protein
MELAATVCVGRELDTGGATVKNKKRGARHKPAPGNPQVNIRFPAEVVAALSRDAIKGGRTIQAVALEIISEHYGIEVVAPRRGRPKRATHEHESRCR